MSGRPVTRMTDTYREILRRLLRGERQAEIARDIEMSPQRLNTIVRSAVFQAEYQRLQGEIEERFVADVAGDRRPVRERLADLAPVAVDALGEVIQDRRQPHARISAAKDVLDRTGHSAPKHSVVTNVQVDARTLGELYRDTLDYFMASGEHEEARRLVASLGQTGDPGGTSPVHNAGPVGPESAGEKPEGQ